MFEMVIMLTTLLCALVAGFVFAFASVVMPGIRSLDDRGFLRAFRVMDGVIQRGQPIFMLVWVGSLLAMIAAVALSFWHVDGFKHLLLLMAAAVYLFGVQLPTAMINVPMNNGLQTVDLEALDEPDVSQVRAVFEDRWVKWNLIRTALATLASVLMIVVLRVG